MFGSLGSYVRPPGGLIPPGKLFIAGDADSEAVLVILNYLAGRMGTGVGFAIRVEMLIFLFCLLRPPDQA